MRPGYILIVAAPSPDAKAHAAAAAECARQKTGMRRLPLSGGSLLVHPALTCLPLPDGFVLGTLHDGGKPAGASAGEEAVRTAAGNRWGDAVVIETASERVRVTRSPFGTLPCYYARAGTLVVAASDAALLLRAGVPRPSIDPVALCGFLTADQYRDERTLLAGISELLPGQALTIGDGHISTSMIWSPWPWTAPVPADADAAPRLRETVDTVTAALAKPFRHVLVGLSGGLDSSIVAGSLARSGTVLSCLNLFTDDARGDERDYARLVAAAAKAVLHERRESPERVDLDHSAAAHLPRPVARAFAQSGDDHHRALAARFGIDAFCGGGGGDNVFAYIPTAAPIADRLLLHGPGPGAFRTAADLALMTRSSVAGALLKGVRRALRPAAYRWPLDAMFLQAEAFAEMAQEFTHPWLTPPAGIPPGKALHVALIMQFANHVDGFDRETVAPRLLPLLTQPVVELCLGIPSWRWCEGGRNRAVARRAFADLPAAVLARTEKGTPGRLLRAVYEMRTQAILAMLEDGILARHGLIDMAAIAAVSARPRLASDRAVFRIMRFVDIEAWARHW